MRFSHALAATALFTCASAHAGFLTTGGIAVAGQGQKTAFGLCTVDFNGFSAANGCGVTYSPSTGTNYVQGSLGGQYAAPANDSSAYFTVGPSAGNAVTITLAAPGNYFGFYAGSLDSYNLVQFFLGANPMPVDSFDGNFINSQAFGTSANGSGAAYINYFTNTLYDRIVYSSSQNAFETDNHAFGIASIPEPGSLALLGLGVLGLAAARSRRNVDRR